MDECEIYSTSNLLKLENKKNFLNYLGNEGIFEELQLFAVEFEKIWNNSNKRNRYLPPFRFQLKLDLIKIQEVSENLYHLFTKEPELSLDFAKEVIHFALALILKTISVEKCDIQIAPLVINLPITNEISDLLKYPSTGLETIRGVLIATTSIVKYVRSSVYSCSKYCLGKKWRISSEEYKDVCPECFGSIQEDLTLTDIGEEILCQFISLGAYQTHGRFQALKVRIKDELCSLLDFQIGEEYIITGRLKNYVFEAMNVQPSEFDLEFYSPFFNQNPTPIPESVVHLYLQTSELCPNCPWTFVFALSSMLGSGLIPRSSFVHLKTGLLLSLSSQKNNEPPVPLIAVGGDLLNTQYLFEAAGKLTDKYVKHCIAHSYLGGAIKPGIQSDVKWQEAGQLILASKGVCNLGDWSKYKKEQGNYICQTIESGQIILNKGELEKTNLINFVPLKCNVWTYWCHITPSRNDQLKLKTLINVFGMPFLAQENNEMEEIKTCLLNLQTGTNTSDKKPTTNEVSLKDLKDFIKIINHRDLTLSDQAFQLIRQYFVVSRRERPHCLPVGAIKTITSLAEAHARLALRHEISYEDVVAIIFLYEETISTIFGASIISYHKSTWNEKEPFYMFMGKQLREFKVWLEEYFLK